MACGKPLDFDNIISEPVKSGRPKVKSTGKGEKERRESASRILENQLKTNTDELKKMLSPKDGRNKLVNELLIDSLGRGKVSENNEGKLTAALKTLLDKQSYVNGLFDKPHKYIGPGGEKMNQPYELLSTSAIIQKGEKGIRTSLGTDLRISGADTVGFGHKFPSHYALGTKKSNTIEADTVIQKPTLTSHRMVGIDAKYSKSRKYGHVTQRQLDGIQNNFNDGNLDEFHFVTNGKFQNSFKVAVEMKNAEILVNRMAKDARVKNEIGHIWTAAEKKAHVPEDTDIKQSKVSSDKIQKNKVSRTRGETRKANETILSMLSENKAEMNRIARQCGVPQIGICEDVNYET